jgi:hypothetical protein
MDIVVCRTLAETRILKRDFYLQRIKNLGIVLALVGKGQAN